MFDRIYINEHGCEYQINVMEVDGKKTYMILKKEYGEKEFRMFSIPCTTFVNDQEAYDHAINIIKNDYKKE